MHKARLFLPQQIVEHPSGTGQGWTKEVGLTWGQAVVLALNLNPRFLTKHPGRLPLAGAWGSAN